MPIPALTEEILSSYPHLKVFDDPLMEECPFVGYPTGWFVVDWSRQLAPGQIKPLHYFGRDLVLWRTEDGEPVVMDAHCPHMGCHLAYGASGREHEHGKVNGRALECPFHGWQWDTQGNNVLIPFTDRVNKAQKIRTYEVREIYGKFVMMWFDELGRAPMWDPPVVPELDRPDLYYLDDDDCAWRYIENIRLVNVMAFENGVDAWHVRFVHGSDASEVEVLADDGPTFRCTFTNVTYRTRTGEVAAPGSIVNELWGMGVVVNRLYGLAENLMFIGATPTDGWNADVFICNFAKRVEGEPHPAGPARQQIEHQLYAVLEDAPIFYRARYVARPPYLPEENKGFRRVRTWMRQFFPLSFPG